MTDKPATAAKRRHTAILGGTFDPPHLGHTGLLAAIADNWPITECWLLPNHIPPHKAGTHASPEQRLAMISAICGQFPAFHVCDIELNRDEPSYTVNTLTRLRELLPDRVFYFVMGMDAFLSLDSWFQWQRLFSLCHLIVCARPGFALPDSHPMARILGQRRHLGPELPLTDSGSILLAAMEARDISSTAIRAAIGRGEDVSQLLPPPVAAVIEKLGLYR